MRPRAPNALFAWPALALLGLSFGLALWSGLSVAHAATPEPILFLGIQRGNNIDRVGTDLVREYLVDRGELVLKTVQLSDTDRRCRRQQCLSELAEAKQAVLVVSGDVSATGPSRNLRVQVRLFDQRRRGTPDALAEIENLCIDCDETKLGIMLTGSTSELLSQYRQFAGSSGPALPGSPASPPAVAGQAQTAPPAPTPAPADAAWPAWQPRPSSAPSAPPVAAPTVESYTQPVPVPPGYAPAMPSPSDPPAQLVPSAPPLPGTPQGTGPATGYVSPPAAYPPATAYAQQPPRPTPVYAQQPTVPVVQASAAKAKKPLSPVRKGIAAVMGVLGFGSLITAAVMHGLDRRLAPDLSVNPMGTACMMKENAGRSCVLSTVGVYAPTYAVGGLMIAGMILTLTIPESKPRPLSEPLIP